jgi:hypothetical protein
MQGITFRQQLKPEDGPCPRSRMEAVEFVFLTGFTASNFKRDRGSQLKVRREVLEMHDDEYPTGVVLEST